MKGNFKFFAPLKVRFNETDLQGHVNFAHYLSYFDVGLTEYLEAIGCSYQTLLAEGVDMLYAESHCKYRTPARRPEVLLVGTRIARLGRQSIRFEFGVLAEEDGREVAGGHIVSVAATRDTRQPCPIPERLREAVARFEGVEPRLIAK